jgi:hypothetical protein
MKMKIKKFFIIFSLVLIPGITFGAIIDCPYLGGGKNLLNYPNEVQPTSTDMGWKIEKEIEKAKAEMDKTPERLKLEAAAKALGIDPTGKSDERLREEIKKAA